jgi:hypothetical protein
VIDFKERILALLRLAKRTPDKTSGGSWALPKARRARTGAGGG